MEKETETSKTQTLRESVRYGAHKVLVKSRNAARNEKYVANERDIRMNENALQRRSMADERL